MLSAGLPKSDRWVDFFVLIAGRQIWGLYTLLTIGLIYFDFLGEMRENV